MQSFAESQGASVAAAQISNLRTKLKGAPTSKGAKSKSGALTAEDLVQARHMADKVGGVARAKELLDILAKLQ